MIHSNHEVKPHRARLVLSWGTRWEARVTNVLLSLQAPYHQYQSRNICNTPLLTSECLVLPFTTLIEEPYSFDIHHSRLS